MESFDPIQLYFREIKNMPPVSPKETKELWKKACKGDKRAQKRLVEMNLRLVIPIAKRYFRTGIDFLDLIEEGNMGLIRAVEKFNPARKVNFSTYATYWIDQGVRRAVEEQSKTIRIPPHVWDAIHKWMKNWNQLQDKFGRNPTLSEMAKKLDMSMHQIQNLIRASKVSQGTSSLETPIDDEGTIYIKDIISDTHSGTPESITELIRQHSDLSQALGSLPERERIIVECRFGLGGVEPASLEEVGKKLKLSRERVRQLEERALKRLKSLAVRMRIIELSESKKILLDSRKTDRRSGVDRRSGLKDRRVGKKDTRKIKFEMRRGPRDRRQNGDRRRQDRRKV